MSEVIALIPARSGSKGVPNKNIHKLGGHTVLGWSISACLKSDLIEKTIVSTDSEDYAQISRSLGAYVPFLRPSSISTDYSTDFEFIDHAISWLKVNNDLPKYIVHIRPTTPFRNPAIIDQAIKLFIDIPTATSLRSVHEMPESAYKTFEIASNGQLKRLCSNSTELDSLNNPRQHFPNTYVANGYVDVLSVNHIETKRLIHGDHVLPFVTPSVDEIDVEEDFRRLEYQLSVNPFIIPLVFGGD